MENVHHHCMELFLKCVYIKTYLLPLKVKIQNSENSWYLVWNFIKIHLDSIVFGMLRWTWSIDDFFVDVVLIIIILSHCITELRKDSMENLMVMHQFMRYFLVHFSFVLFVFFMWILFFIIFRLNNNIRRKTTE